MRHRINKVVPDIDNRLLEPDAARQAKNLRFAASINNTDQATTLVNGLAEILYPSETPLPEGDNQVIGQKEDFENQAVYFMLWNSNDDGGLYQIKNGAIALVLKVPGLVEDSDVSIAIIDGKAYWTDNENAPRMCNIAKGLAVLYPDPLEEWMITQIKRPPADPLIISPNDFTLDDASIEYDNLFPNPIPVQFSYYYVYDNDEESRLGPWSEVIWWSTNLTLTIFSAEYDNYLDGINIVKSVVFVFRRGNNGIPYEIKRVTNDGSFTGEIEVADISLLPKTAVSTDITDADFDSVPLLSVSNEVAQNRLNHGNYLIDYPNWTGLTLEVNVVPVVLATTSNQTTLKPGGVYNVGIELLDQWGRKIGVVNQQQFQVPGYQKWNYFIGSAYPTEAVWRSAFEAGNTFWDKDKSDNCYQLEYTITGTLPSWCSTFRVVYSPVLNITDSQRTNVKMYYWYTKEGVDYLSVTDKGLNESGYYRNGMCLELTSGEPFLFTAGSDSFVNIIGQYGFSGSLIGTTPGYYAIPSGWAKPFKITKQVNSFLYFEIINSGFLSDIVPGLGTAFQPIPGNPGFPIPSYWDIELTVQSNSPSEIYYQNTSFLASDVSFPANGVIYGDYFINKYIKPNFGQLQNILGFPFSIYYDTFSEPTVTVYGIDVSRNPVNLFSQSWNKTIGQPNVVNPLQRQKRILQGILFSNPLIQGTQINGLSKFNSVDNRQAPLENGPITALVRTSATQREPGVLLAIGKNGVQSFYYDGVQLTNVDGTANVSTTTQYLASQRPLVGNFGADRLRDICVTPLGTVYYWSEGIQDLIRYTNAGLQQLGETYEFMNYLRNQLEPSDRFMITYDQVTDEVILVGNESNSYIFSERYKTFQGDREYFDADNVRPERGANLSNRTYFFLKGRVWQMGPQLSVNNNSFFGVTRDPELMIITNVEPETVKRWNSIKIMGPKPLTTALSSEAPETADDDVLSSYIEPGWWIQRKWDFEASIKTSIDDDGQVMNGRIMESRLLISTFAWDANDFVKLNYIDVKATRSPVQ